MVQLQDLITCDPMEWDRLYKKWFSDRHLPYAYNMELMMDYIERLEAAVNERGR